MNPIAARIGGFIVALALLSGCATQSPTTRATSTPPPVDALVANGETPALLDPALLENIPVTVKSETTYSPPVFAVWPQFGKPKIDAAISAYYRQHIAKSADQGADSDPGKAPAELNLDWHLIGSSPSMIGIVADGYRDNGESLQLNWRTLWFDLSTDTVYDNAGLVDETATKAALQVAASQRVVQVPSLDLSKVGANPVADASLLAFSPSGALIVGFEACQVAACDAGRVTITVAKAEADKVLREPGQRAQVATQAPRDPVGANLPTATPPAPSGAPANGSTRVNVNCKKAKCIALTFDDGPGPYTTKLLGYLRQSQTPATFFMLGQQVQSFPKVARAVAADGHEVGVHTWSHPQLTRLSPAQIDRQLNSTINVLQAKAGVTPTLLRPPYGATNATVRAEAKKAGLAVILWNVDTLDWKTLSTSKTIAAAVHDTRRNSIILVHDIHPTSVEAVPGIISALRAKGYTFVTVTQLIGKPLPGKQYRSGKS